jgi:serine phosphatase RsbU (regulator of sigma subunit)
MYIYAVIKFIPHNLKNYQQMSSRCFSFALFVLLLFLHICQSDLQAQNGYNYMVHFETKESRKDVPVTALAFDQRHNIIIGSRLGISIFDGNRQSKVKNSPKEVFDLQNDSAGEFIYSGSKNDFGFVHINPYGQSEYISLKPNNDDIGNITKVALNNKQIVFGGKKHIFIADEHTRKIQKHIAAETKEEFIGFFMLKNDIFINIKGKGVHKIEDGTPMPVKGGKTFKNTAIAFFAPYNAHSILLGTDNNTVYIFNNRGFKQFSKNTDVRKFLEENILRDGLRFNKESFVLTTITGGAVIIDRIYGEIRQTVNYQSGLPEDEITAQTIDENNGLWLAHPGGISRYTVQSAIKDFSPYPGIYGKVNDVLYRNNSLYAASNNGLYQLSEIRNYREKQIIVKQKARYGYKFTPKQTYVLQSINYTFTPLSQLTEKIKQLELVNDSIFIAITDLGIYQVNDTLTKKLLEDIYMNDLFAASDTNLLYAATLKGIQTISFKYDTLKNETVWKKAKILPSVNTQIFSVAADENGNLFFGTDRKAFRAERTAEDSFNAPEEIKFPVNINEAVQVKKYKNNILFIQSAGIFRYDTQSKSAVRDTTFRLSDAETLVRLSQPNYRSDFKTNKNALLIKLFPEIRKIRSDQNGNIWIINGAKGIFCIRPDSLEATTANFDVHIVSVRDKQDSLYIPESLKLDYKRNALRVEVSAPFFMLPENTQFRHKIKGLENYEEWSEWSKNPIIELYSLPPGNYTFTVMAKNVVGQTSSEKSFRFSVAKPFTQTELFYFILSLSALVLFLIIFFLGRYRLKVKNRKLEKIINERTAEIREQNQKLETQKEEISAQRDILAERNEEIESQRDQLAKQNKKIETQNRKIKDSITYASNIQEAILPNDDYISELFPENFIYYRPRDIVSGDFYWFAERRDAIYFAAADCTGHGVPGAFMSMLGVSFLNNIVNTSRKKDLTPADILTTLTDKVIEALQQTGDPDEAKDGMDIALCKIERSSGKASFAGAFNPLYLVYDGKIRVLEPNRRPIGIYEFMDKVKPFENQEFEVREKDMLYVFSDGYVDQFGGEKDKKFNINQFKKLLIKIHKMPLNEQKNELERVMENWKQNQEQLDDLLVIGIKI